MLVLLSLVGCGDKIAAEDFPSERAIAYCELLQECGTLDAMGMDAYDCQLAQGQAYQGCSEDDYDRRAASDCLDEIAAQTCDRLDEPLDDIAPSCAEVCP